MTTEAKVGAFTLIGLALLAYMIVHLSGFSFSGSKGYNINVLFSQANGLRPGAVVRYAARPVLLRSYPPPSVQNGQQHVEARTACHTPSTFLPARHLDGSDDTRSSVTPCECYLHLRKP